MYRIAVKQRYYDKYCSELCYYVFDEKGFHFCPDEFVVYASLGKGRVTGTIRYISNYIIDTKKGTVKTIEDYVNSFWDDVGVDSLLSKSYISLEDAISIIKRRAETVVPKIMKSESIPS